MGQLLHNPEVPESPKGAQGLPRFGTERPKRGRLFWSNLHDFLYERPVKIEGNDNYLRPVEFGASFGDNLKEWFRPGVRGATRSTMLVEAKPWYRSFLENVREAIRLAGKPPVKLDRPVEVGELWNPPRKYRRVQLLVFLGHALVALLILVPLFPRITEPSIQPTVVQLDISPYEPAMAPKAGKAVHGGGGGGERSPVPQTRGRLPRFSMTQFTPPMAKILPHPKLAMEATVLGSPNIKLVSPPLPNYGDPLSKLITQSGGPGEGGGIGTGSGGGVGSGSGGGVGPGYGYGTGGGYPSGGQGGYSEPDCLFCPSPQFSDEAVKLKYQGTVLVRLVVTASGSTEDVQVIRNLGLGLDQQVIDAVRTWRWKPSIGPDGKPHAVSVVVEVNFRLL